jgi:NAD(P)-dependent dehydrogenase (short-subunit alcohol dehydrogenase family)
MSGIKDKVVVITGASSGIGEATALLLAERGAKVVLGARGLERLEALTARIRAAGGEAAFAATDVRRRDDVAALVKLAYDRYGKLDVLVNNAGIGPISPLDELRVEDWENMIDINIKGVLYGIAAGVPRAGFRAHRQHGFYGGSSHRAEHGGLCRHEDSRARHLRRLATGGRPQAACNGCFAGLHADELRGIHDKSRHESPDRRVHGQVRDAAGCNRPRHCFRDRAAGGC